MEQFYALLNNEQQQLKLKERRRVTIAEVARKISQYFGYYQYKAHALFFYIRARKLQKDLMNPIQVYSVDVHDILI